MLVYGIEAILSIEVELSALQMVAASQLSLEQAEYGAKCIVSLKAINKTYYKREVEKIS